MIFRTLDLCKLNYISIIVDLKVLLRCIIFIKGRVFISGSESGLIIVSSLSTGMTIRVINDHKAGAICNIRQQKVISYWLSGL